jgi:hypothetical protein
MRQANAFAVYRIIYDIKFDLLDLVTHVIVDKAACLRNNAGGENCERIRGYSKTWRTAAGTLA